MSDITGINFQRIIDTSSDGILVINKSGVVLFVNPATEKLFERSHQELVGSMFGFPIVSGETTELSIVRKDGHPCIVEMRVVAMKLDSDAVHLATLRDVTERSLKEQEIVQQKLTLEQTVDERTLQRDRYYERLNTIFNTTNDSILLLDSNGVIEMVNPAFTRLLEYTPDDVVNQPLSHLLAPQHKRQLKSAIKQVTKTGKSFRGEMVALRRNRTPLDIEISLAWVMNNENHMVCNLHDISHHKAVDRMKDEFVSMVNHELRTPIATALLSMELVVNYYEKLSSGRIREKLVQSHNNIVALKELVEGVLEYAASQAPNNDHDIRMFEVKNTLERVSTELKQNILSKRQNLHVFIDEERMTIRGKELDFTRIWRNLISNAIKYTPEEGRIFIRLTCLRNAETLDKSELRDKDQLRSVLNFGNARYLIGQVEDSGFGIKKEDFDTLFEPFTRGWAKETNIPGTGLGLSLVRELLISYDGNILVSSEVGKGSIFTFWVPIDRVS